MKSLLVPMVVCMACAGWPGRPLLAADVLTLKSPNGRIAAEFQLTDKGEPVYRVSSDGKPILTDSHLGLVPSNAPPLNAGFKVVRSAGGNRDETWKPVCGERAVVRDRCNTLTVDLEETSAPGRRLQLTWRAYDEGVAFCYTVPAQPGWTNLALAAEATEFAFTGNHAAWPVYAAQGQYKPARLADVKPNCERPLTVEIDGGPVVAVGEARLVDFARMRLQPVPDRPFALRSHLGSGVTASLPCTTPWRYVMIGETPGQLLEHNDLVLNLNDPCAIADTSWIKPGKVIREVTLTTEGGKACVDFARKMNLQYVEYDAGWYGHEYDNAADARAVNLDPKRSKGPLDLHEVIRYGKEYGIGIILYVNQRALERQLDEILPLYQSWGVKGVKYGFVNVGSQRWTAWLHEAIRKAADHKLMLDIHDEYRTTGNTRTYPNLMTVEGILGNEGMPPPEHNTVLPFTRFLCGPGDYTFCWSSPRTPGTHAHQLGASTVFYSPWQFLFWYDRPAQYRDEPELEYWQHLPTTWDETRVLHGAIGRHAVIARRKGTEWFVGGINAVERRTIEIPLTFLESGRKYTAWMHRDGAPEGGAPTNVKTEQLPVELSTVLSVDMAANGGFAARLVPAK